MKPILFPTLHPCLICGLEMPPDDEAFCGEICFDKAYALGLPQTKGDFCAKCLVPLREGDVIPEPESDRQETLRKLCKLEVACRIRMTCPDCRWYYDDPILRSIE